MTWLRIESERPNVMGVHENLCWGCSKATGKCMWSEDLLPIPGWDAEPDGDSYKIRDCPQFEKADIKSKR